MRNKFLAILAVVLVGVGLGWVVLPANAQAAQTAWHARLSCTTNSTGHCTQIYQHPIGSVPVIQVTPEGTTSMVHTYQVTATSFRVRVMQTTSTPWANRTLTLAVSAFAVTGATQPSPSASVRPSGSVSPSASVSPSPSTTTPPPTTADYPTANTTGVPAGTALTVHNGNLVITEANTVVNAKRITGDVDVRASGVVIKNSEVNGRVINDNVSNNPSFTLEDSTVGPTTCSTWTAGAIGTKNYTAKRVHLRGFVDGFRIAGGNVLIEDSYVKLCGTNPEYHSDGIQAYGAAGGKNIVIRHNVVDQTGVIGEAQTSPLFIPVDPGQGNDNIEVTVDNNVLAGGGFTLRVYGTGPFSVPSMSGNKIVDGTWGYGPLDINCARIAAFSGNSVVKYDFATGKILSQVRSLDSECPKVTTPPTTNPPVAAFPSADNTGVPAGTTLAAYPCTGDETTITADNTVIDSKTVNCDLVIKANNVVVKKSRVVGSVYTPDGALNYSFRVEDSEISHPVITDWGRTMVGEANFTVLRTEVTGGNRGIYCRKNCTVQDSWIHGTKVTGTLHASAIRVSQGAKLIHNTIHCDVPDSGEAGCSANMTGYPDFEPVKDNTVEGNLFKATPGGFCAYGGATGSKPYSNATDNATNVVFKDNVFEKGTASGKCGWWGPITDFAADRTGNAWTNNKWDDGSVVNP
jgi:hypothetical protein